MSRANTVITLLAFGVCATECELFFGGSGLTPPGNVWSWGDTLAYAVLLLGSHVAARREKAWFPQLAYGLLAAVPFWLVLGPDNRDYLSIAAGQERIEDYLGRYLLFVLASGLLCVVVAKITQRFWPPPLPDPTRCRKCGYLLQGLPEPRCPECGTRFDVDPPLHSAP
jgi:hypothetical protein